MHQLAIYELNAQSADKLDERRDATTRAHGGLCIVVATAAVGAFGSFPSVSAILWAFLFVIALGWLATLNALTAKLSAKHELLIKMEAHQDETCRFLTQEREEWESLKSLPLQKALARAPIAFIVLGAGGLLGTLAHVASKLLCL